MGNPKWLIGLAMLFLMISFVCLLMEDSYLGDYEISRLNAIMSSGFNISGIVAIAGQAWPMLTWDYAFFHEGIGMYFRLFLFTLSMALIFEFATVIARIMIPWAS